MWEAGGQRKKGKMWKGAERAPCDLHRLVKTLNLGHCHHPEALSECPSLWQKTASASPPKWKYNLIKVEPRAYVDF